MNNALLIILITFWRSLILLPRVCHIVLSNIIGSLLYIAPLKRNKYSKINIDFCFPNKSESERKKIFKKNIMLSGNILADTGISWFWSDERIKKNIKYEITGLDKLLAEQSAENGVLLFFKHSLHLELDSRIIGMHAKIYGVERKHNSEYFQSLFSAVHGDVAPLVRIAWRNSTPKVLSTVSKTGRSVGVSGGQDDDG